LHLRISLRQPPSLRAGSERKRRARVPDSEGVSASTTTSTNVTDHWSASRVMSMGPARDSDSPGPPAQNPAASRGRSSVMSRPSMSALASPASTGPGRDHRASPAHAHANVHVLSDTPHADGDASALGKARPGSARASRPGSAGVSRPSQGMPAPLGRHGPSETKKTLKRLVGTQVGATQRMPWQMLPATS
jgi:hypothetical protein